MPIFVIPITIYNLTPPLNLFRGVFWQTDCHSLNRIANYNKLGSDKLIIQWTSVGSESFSGIQGSRCHIDWNRAIKNSGSSRVILGLQGSYNPSIDELPNLATQSKQLANSLSYLNPAGYYAPVELHPEMPEKATLAYLNNMPRPLWVSVYANKDNYNILVNWIQASVPKDVYVLVQDGVGAGNSTAEASAKLVRDLRKVRGNNVGIIVEVFRKIPFLHKYRSITAWELKKQIKNYNGLPMYAFDGGHYMNFIWIWHVVSLWQFI